MKQTTLIKSAVLAGTALLAGFASAGDDPVPAAPSSDLEVNIGVGYTSEYIFRSINFADDLFTAGIGEHQPLIRAGVLEKLGWLGFTLDRSANADGGPLLTTSESRCQAYAIPTDEECIIAEQTLALI